MSCDDCKEHTGLVATVGQALSQARANRDAIEKVGDRLVEKIDSFRRWQIAFLVSIVLAMGAALLKGCV